MAAQKKYVETEQEVSESLQALVKRLQAELEAARERRLQAESVVTSLRVKLKAERKKWVQARANSLRRQLHDAFVWGCELWSEVAGVWKEDLESECGHPSLPEEREGWQRGSWLLPRGETEQAKLQHDERTDP